MISKGSTAVGIRRTCSTYCDFRFGTKGFYAKNNRFICLGVGSRKMVTVTLILQMVCPIALWYDIPLQ